MLSKFKIKLASLKIHATYRFHIYNNKNLNVNYFNQDRICYLAHLLNSIHCILWSDPVVDLKQTPFKDFFTIKIERK